MGEKLWQEGRGKLVLKVVRDPTSSPNPLCGARVIHVYTSFKFVCMKCTYMLCHMLSSFSLSLCTAVKGIKKQHLVEVRSLPSPPRLVKMAMESICLLIGEPTTEWKSIRSILIRENFIPTIINFSTEDITWVEGGGRGKRMRVGKVVLRLYVAVSSKGTGHAHIFFLCNQPNWKRTHCSTRGI